MFCSFQATPGAQQAADDGAGAGSQQQQQQQQQTSAEFVKLRRSIMFNAMQVGSLSRLRCHNFACTFYSVSTLPITCKRVRPQRCYLSFAQDTVKRRNEFHLIKEGLSVSDIFFSKVSGVGDILVSLELEIRECPQWICCSCWLGPTCCQR